MQTTIDAAGRVVIPKRLRESAGLRPGAKIDINLRDGTIAIEPVVEPIKWVRKGTLMVAVAPKGTPRLTVKEADRLVEELREARIQELIDRGK